MEVQQPNLSPPPLTTLVLKQTTSNKEKAASRSYLDHEEKDALHSGWQDLPKPLVFHLQYFKFNLGTKPYTKEEIFVLII